MKNITVLRQSPDKNIVYNKSALWKHYSDPKTTPKTMVCCENHLQKHVLSRKVSGKHVAKHAHLNFEKRVPRRYLVNY